MKTERIHRPLEEREADTADSHANGQRCQHIQKMMPDCAARLCSHWLQAGHLGVYFCNMIQAKPYLVCNQSYPQHHCYLGQMRLDAPGRVL